MLLMECDSHQSHPFAWSNEILTWSNMARPGQSCRALQLDRWHSTIFPWLADPIYWNHFVRSHFPTNPSTRPFLVTGTHTKSKAGAERRNAHGSTGTTKMQRQLQPWKIGRSCGASGGPGWLRDHCTTTALCSGARQGASEAHAAQPTPPNPTQPR